RHHKKVNNKRPPKHFKFLEELHEQLLAIDSSEMFDAIAEATTARERTVPSPSRTESQRQSVAAADVDIGHRLEENPDTAEGAQGVKRRHRSCKVCAIHKSKPRKFTKYFCPECSSGNKRLDTCFTIWHNEWNNGNDIPQLLLQEHKTRDRPPASRPGKKRRHRQQQNEEEGGNAEADSLLVSVGTGTASNDGGEEMAADEI
ncbi:Hypothetical protein PHPALM_13614, partial [Phytophthora palmivora]